MHRIRFTILAIAATFALLAAPRPATASDATDALTTVQNFIASFNKGDEKAALATCASPAAIVDEFSPHTWTGATACADWFAAFDADATKRGITGEVVTLGTPWHVDVTGSRAYIVTPANYAYKQHGKAVREIGSVLTIVLLKSASGWHMTAWTWAKH
jgi:hypothetical protein